MEHRAASQWRSQEAGPISYVPDVTMLSRQVDVNSSHLNSMTHINAISHCLQFQEILLTCRPGAQSHIARPPCSASPPLQIVGTKRHWLWYSRLGLVAKLWELGNSQDVMWTN